MNDNGTFNFGLETQVLTAAHFVVENHTVTNDIIYI